MNFLKCNELLSYLKTQLNPEMVSGTANINVDPSFIVERIDLILTEKGDDKGILYILKKWDEYLSLNLTENPQKPLSEEELYHIINNIYFIINIAQYLPSHVSDKDELKEKAYQYELIKFTHYGSLPVKFNLYHHFSVKNSFNTEQSKKLLRYFCKHPECFVFENISDDIFVFDKIKEFFDVNESKILLKNLQINLISIIQDRVSESESFNDISIFFRHEMSNVSYINSEIFTSNDFFSLVFEGGFIINNMFENEKINNIKVQKEILKSCESNVITLYGKDTFMTKDNSSLGKERFLTFVKEAKNQNKTVAIENVTFSVFVEIFSWDFLLEMDNCIYLKNAEVDESDFINIPYTDEKEIEKAIMILFTMESGCFSIPSKTIKEKISSKFESYVMKSSFKIPFLEKKRVEILEDRLDKFINFKNNNLFTSLYDLTDMQSKLKIIEMIFKNKKIIPKSFLGRHYTSVNCWLSLHPENILSYYLSNLTVSLSEKIEIIHDISKNTDLNIDLFWIFYFKNLLQKEIKDIENELKVNTQKHLEFILKVLEDLYVINGYGNARYRTIAEENFPYAKKQLIVQSEKEIISINTSYAKEDVLEENPRKKRRL